MPRSVPGSADQRTRSTSAERSTSCSRARDDGVRRVVFASSSSVYGDATEFPRDETQRPQPLSPYGVAKLAAESYCRAFGRYTASRRSRSATSTSSARGRIRARSTRRWCRASSRRCSRTSARDLSATGTSRGTSPTSRMSSQATCSPLPPRTSLRRGSERGDGEAAHGQPARLRDPGARRSPTSSRSTSRPGWARSSTLPRTSRVRHGYSGMSRDRASRKGSRPRSTRCGLPAQ